MGTPGPPDEGPAKRPPPAGLGGRPGWSIGLAGIAVGVAALALNVTFLALVGRYAAGLYLLGPPVVTCSAVLAVLPERWRRRPGEPWTAGPLLALIFMSAALALGVTGSWRLTSDPTAPLRWVGLEDRPPLFRF